MKKKTKKSLGEFFRFIGRVLLFIIKIPYYIIKEIILFIGFIIRKTKERNIKNKREEMIANYEDFKIINKEKGDYEKSIKKIYSSESIIGIILGARGSGKSAIGIKLLENAYSKYNKTCFAIGFNKNDMPGFINIVTSPSEIKNDSIVLIDEGGVLFSSRNAMSTANKILSELILISRHKNISILFISQNSSNLDVNILRQADFLILKSSSLLQKEFERKIIQKIYDETQVGFEKNKAEKGIAYIYSNDFKGFVSNPLPSFWKTSISKSFR